MNGVQEVFFNELSLQPFCGIEEMHNHVREFASVLRHCVELGYRKVRYEHDFSSIMISAKQSLADYCYEFNRRPDLNTAINLMLSMQCRPYIPAGTQPETKYLENDYEIEIGLEKLAGFGMTAAYLSNSFAVGFCSSPKWEKQCCFVIRIQNSTETHQINKVFCLSNAQHFDDDDFVNWFVSHHSVAYVKRGKEPFCHLRNDHGKKVLEDFARRIMKEDFVEGIVNSLPFNPKASRFVESMDENGLINLRLTDTDYGFGLAVQTVGRNKIQITYFAKRLNEKYRR